MATEAASDQVGSSVLPELVEGKQVYLSLWNPSPSSSTERTALSCTIAKSFRPFTISPVFLVSIVAPPITTRDNRRVPIPTSVVLKLYDRRCLSNVRGEWDERRPWSLEKEHAYRRYLDGVAAGTVTRRGDSDFDDVWFLWDNNVSDGEFEAYLRHDARKAFDAERATYGRLQPLQGTKIPKVYGVVEYEAVIPGAHPHADGSAVDVTETVPGLLLEYVPSLTLRELIATWTARDPPLPNRILATLCEKSVQVVDRVSDFDVLNEDVRMDNLLIRQPFLASSSSSSSLGDLGDWDQDLTVVEDAVVLIDLGHCRFRREDESEEEWIRAKYYQDETGAAGFVALGLVRKFVGHDVWAYERSSRYYYPSVVSAE